MSGLNTHAALTRLSEFLCSSNITCCYLLKRGLGTEVSENAEVAEFIIIMLFTRIM